VPIYEYACPDCGHEFETMQKVSEPRLTDCPSCQSHHLKKKVSATSFTLKGSGWYKDHYGLKQSGGDSSTSDSGGGDSGGGGGDSGGDSGAGGGDGGGDSASGASSTPAPAASSGSGGSE